MSIQIKDYADVEKNIQIQRPPCPIKHGVVAFDVDSLPSESGIYFAWNGKGEIAYVGQATNIRTRASVTIKQGIRDGGKVMACDLISWVTCSVHDLDWMEKYYIRYTDPARNGKDKLSFSLGSVERGATVAMGAVALIGSQASAVQTIDVIRHSLISGEASSWTSRAYLLGDGRVVYLDRYWSWPPGTKSRKSPTVPNEMQRPWIPAFARQHQELFYGSFMSRWDEFPLCQKYLDAACAIDLPMLRMIAANFHARFPLLYRPQGERQPIHSGATVVTYSDELLSIMAKNGDPLDERACERNVAAYNRLVRGEAIDAESSE